MISSAEIRSRFLDFFATRGHEVVASSPLVPANDPTLLFTNAGMVQFKDVFTGKDKRGYKRAVSSQRCVRAGGKHNDLDQVGYTARHHTFFEMMGNFSFGDYFKNDAILFAWELLTDGYGLEAERLWVTVYETDDEAYDIWHEKVGVPRERIVRIGDKPGGRRYESDNFWAMGDTGPCGPCTEVFYDHGPEVAGGPPGSPEEDGDRYVEIWNLVFMQFDRDASGEMTPLPAPCVDTGMGLERLAAVLQGVHSNYDIDLFQALIRAAAERTDCQDLTSNSLKVIADHIRACAFLIVDGVLPSNEGRGYVLRRIIRRAIRHGYKLGKKEAFFHAMVKPLVEQMGEAYPELAKNAGHVSKVLRKEEQRFAETLDQGMRILERAFDSASNQSIDGDTAFKLYDTYGFPLDLTADVARERGFSVDEAGFEAAMEAQRKRARDASRFDAADDEDLGELDTGTATVFLGYDGTDADDCLVRQIIVDGRAVDNLDQGQRAIVVLEQTPFYAESGGQVGDTGVLRADGARFQVGDTRKYGGQVHGHVGQLGSGQLAVGDRVRAEVDSARRQAVVLNHSATHLMHAALRNVLGDHVQQKGSLVAPDRLRFDFSHYEPVTDEQLQAIEDEVNAEIRRNVDASAREMSYDDAIAGGALAFFGDKYGDQVRVLRFGDYSVELCGGTHVDRVGDIGLFKIVSETGIAAGVRRIEAVTGGGALDWLRSRERSLDRVARLTRSAAEEVPEKVEQLMARTRELEKQLEQLKGKLAASAGEDLASSASDVDGIKVIAATLPGANVKALRDTVDQLKNKLGAAAIVLGAVEDGQVRLVAGVTKSESQRIKAGDLVNYVASQVGGRGGGRPDMAQAGGNDAEALPAALDGVTDWVRQQLSQ